MSTSKYIDQICLVVIALTLLITGLFMNGAALGIQPVTDPDMETEEGYFTRNDLDGSWSSSGATRITLKGTTGNVVGNGAYIQNGDVHIIYPGRYVLSGELTDGQIIIEAAKGDKVWLLLDGATLHCEESAAIVVEQAKKVFLTLAEGTVNTVSSGATYSQEAVDAKIDGAIYSRDDLTVNGSGSLTVTAPYKHGIVGNDDLVIAGGTITITAAQDGIQANDSVSVANSDLTIYAGDDGITVSNDDESAWFYMESGTVTIPACYEGIEAIDITIAGGTVDIRPTDDGINANGQGRNSIIRITGGDITIINETGRDADGLDSNGSIEISGGRVFISVNISSYALDCGTESGGTCTVSGGTVIAAGGSAMAEGFESDSPQAFLMHNTANQAAGTVVTLTGEDGKVLLSETIPCAFSSLVISTPEMRLGERVTLTVGETDTELTVDNTSMGGFGMGGMFGGRGQGGMWGGNQQGGMPGGQGGRGDWSGGGMPGGGFQGPNGGLPQGPGGGSPQDDGEEIPDGPVPQSGAPQAPEGGPNGQGNGFDPSQFGQMRGQKGNDNRAGDQLRDWVREQETQAEEEARKQQDTMLLMGGSVFCLLAGLAFALKVKH